MYLGIDLGTSSVKFVLMNDDQYILTQSSEPLSVSQPYPLWSEQNPEHWWTATCKGIAELRQKYSRDFAAIKAIGLSGQQHGAVLIDKHHNPIRPAILWNDGRAGKQCDMLTERVPTLESIIGSRIMAGFTAPKILWVKEHEPELFKNLAKVLLPKDFLRLRLTENYATDLSDASGTGWLDIAKRNWSDAMLQATDLRIDHMPTLHEGSKITSLISKSIASEWGVSTDTIVVGGGGDNPAAAISMNVIKPGKAFLSLGTSGVYFVASDVYKTNSQGGVHSFCHCLPNTWHHMTVHLSSASCLAWLASIVNARNTAELLDESERNFVDKHSLLFLPYLSGERSPHNNPHAKGVFFGLDTLSARHDLTRAVLEGVAFAFAEGQAAMLKANISIDEVSVVGGGSQSLYWGRILASALNRPLTYRKNREVGAALGAARLAWLGIHDSDPQSAFVSPAIETIIEPEPRLVAAYQKKKEIFSKLYNQLENLFPTL